MLFKLNEKDDGDHVLYGKGNCPVFVNANFELFKSRTGTNISFGELLSSQPSEDIVPIGNDGTVTFTTT